MRDLSVDQLQAELNSAQRRQAELKQEFFEIHESLRENQVALSRVQISQRSGPDNSKYASCLDLKGAIIELQQRECDVSAALTDASNSIMLLQYQISKKK